MNKLVTIGCLICADIILEKSSESRADYAYSIRKCRVQRASKKKAMRHVAIIVMTKALWQGHSRNTKTELIFINYFIY